MLKKGLVKQVDEEMMDCEHGTYSKGEDKVFYPQKKEKAMADREFKSWWDLTEKERDDFRQYVIKHNVQGWGELKETCEACGFDATEDMSTVYELKEDGGAGVRLNKAERC